LQTKISLDKMALFLNINKNYLCELFKKETGITINNYIIRKKIEMACKLISLGEYEVNDMSDILGFSSSSYFIKVFKSVVGMTPNQYKIKQMRNVINGFSSQF